MADTTEEVAGQIESLLGDAKARLTQAEAVAAVIPRLRQEIRVLERSVRDIREPPKTKRRTGPTIKERILTHLATAGTVTFPPGGMLPTIHDAVDGNRNSVQVEIHRLEDSGDIVIERDYKARPISMRAA